MLWTPIGRALGFMSCTLVFSVLLLGAMVQPVEADIIGFVAHDVDADLYSVAVIFDADTGQPHCSSCSQTEVDELFTFYLGDLGTYSGYWYSGTEFRITIGTEPAFNVITPGTTYVDVKPALGGTSCYASQTCVTLTGSFGDDPGPVLIDIAAVPLVDDNVYGDGDAIRLYFSHPTDAAGFGLSSTISNVETQEMFEASGPIATEVVSGSFINEQVFELVIVSHNLANDLCTASDGSMFNLVPCDGCSVPISSPDQLSPATGTSPNLDCSKYLSTFDPVGLNSLTTDGSRVGWVSGAKMSFHFSSETNTAIHYRRAHTKSEVDAFVSLSDSHSLGADYFGYWQSASQYTIECINPIGATFRGYETTFTINGASLKDRFEVASVTLFSPILGGGFSYAPSLSTAEWFGTGSVPGMDVGDTLLLTFDQDTSVAQNTVWSDTDVALYIRFEGSAQNIQNGPKMTGLWTSASTLLLTIIDVTGSEISSLCGECLADTFVSIEETANVRSADGLSERMSPDASVLYSGTFGLLAIEVSTAEGLVTGLPGNDVLFDASLNNTGCCDITFSSVSLTSTNEISVEDASVITENFVLAPGETVNIGMKYSITNVAPDTYVDNAFSITDSPSNMEIISNNFFASPLYAPTIKRAFAVDFGNDAIVTDGVDMIWIEFTHETDMAQYDVSFYVSLLTFVL